MERSKRKEHLCESCFYKYYGSGMCPIVGINTNASYVPDCWSWKDSITLKGQCDEVEEIEKED